MREVVQNPLSPFAGTELAAAGLPAAAIDALPRLPADLLPDETLAAHGVPPTTAHLLVKCPATS